MDHAAVIAPTRVRHTVLWLTVAAYMITYIDRVVISAAVPSIQEEFGFSIVTMGWILGAYQLSYALFQIPGGWLGRPLRSAACAACDRRVVVRVHRGYRAHLVGDVDDRLPIPVWYGRGGGLSDRDPIAVTLDAALGARLSHKASRTPAHVWAERSRPSSSSSSLLTTAGARRFYIFAVLGLLWAAIWYWFYRDSPNEHRMVNAAERELIANALGNTANRSKIVPWRRILRSPQMWLLSAMYFCYGYDIGIFLTWFPKYLHAERQFELQQMGFYASLPLLAGVAGDICGGWFSDLALKRTGNLKFARRVVAIPGFLIASRDDSARLSRHRSARQCRVFRARGVRYRADGRCFMGGDAGHRWRVCGFRVGGDEHLRQSGRRHCGGDDWLYRDRERLDDRVLRARRLLVGGRDSVHAHRCIETRL